MGILSIKIRIGDKDYPMKVDENEEELLRAAGKQLNEKLKSFKELYHIEEKVDLLAMVAFDSMVSQLKYGIEQSKNEQNLVEKLTYLNAYLTKNISV